MDSLERQVVKTHVEKLNGAFIALQDFLEAKDEAVPESLERAMDAWDEATYDLLPEPAKD
jgi:hypothetical protein